jgi:hypothetical protein
MFLKLVDGDEKGIFVREKHVVSCKKHVLLEPLSKHWEK